MRLGEYPYNPQFATANQPDTLASEDPAQPLPPPLVREAAKLLRFGIGRPLLARMIAAARDNGTSVESELLASGSILEHTYYESLAGQLGLPFIPFPDGCHVQDLPGIDSQLIEPSIVRIHHSSRPPVTAIVPRLDQVEKTANLLARVPQLRASLAITTPTGLRKAVWTAGSVRRVAATSQALFDEKPVHSARIVLWGKQGFYIGMALCALLVMTVVQPWQTLVALHFLFTAVYMANLLIRLAALGRESSRRRYKPAVSMGKDALPVYSVFVALYRERAVAQQLVTALDALDWPRTRLDIKLICEEDDLETLAALRALPLGPEYEIVEVPQRQPRTKPKALAYTLPAARGHYLAVYDAEDRPHPGQLREAHERFAVCPDNVACLQAPLVITNAGSSWLSALFAMEYAGLFRGLVPLLAARNLPVPLGGTSNHFRTDLLRVAGGWDPYNMTEDADLGMRLHRLGYRSDVILLPTLEDAPTKARAWMGQRTRWFKGWLQTWLVLMRNPVALMEETGLRGFVVLQILIAGMLISSLAHPIIFGFLVFLSWALIEGSPQLNTPLTLGLFIADTLNIFGSYTVFIALGRNRMSKAEQKAVGWRWLFVPGYWILISIAAWKAVAELKTNPFFWNKTEHKPVMRGRS
ncbi:glycosyltransferase family 2 protein [Pararhizobium sp.]|uniref:glycosyltransferase family 2 protein n=1 Tax=Pararhizobium sp. TaxID=1977563 RepID=UPI002721A9A3|nr:glycosyltransferase [Pararhizobium sp.]MDO9416322.1 glycosyltransferase [Pararhizobium sp.]